MVISCTFLTDETASHTVLDMQDNTVYSQTWIFTTKAKFLPWVLPITGRRITKSIHKKAAVCNYHTYDSLL